MQNDTLSLLEELEQMPRRRDSKHIIESRAENIIGSAINLINLIAENYTEEQADDLTRKMLNSIKNKDVLKFKRSLGRINESIKSKVNK